MKLHAAKRMHNVKLHVDTEARPGWLSGHLRTPAVGEEVFCTMGAGEVAAIHGKTGDGSRLLQIRLAEAGTPPFYAAASNVLVRPLSGAERERPAPRAGPAPDALAPDTGGWLG